ncbi:restriction endonuclease subunit S [Methanoregula sp.]|uniref:restriction endonuclease subunit S n=1 Tax=Methanoregula sp. TaxID=2052170 RepID=UPI0026272DC5|nr:restriction endonuclease subunit S [Methanoregula sp.]MDD5141805.1 restriction endonuclease subunit S [Methanoregula sp.]
MKPIQSNSSDSLRPLNEPEIPDGWTLERIGDLISITSGKSIKNSEYSKTPDRPYPVAGAGGPIGWSDEFNFLPPIITLGRVGSAGSLNVYHTNTWVTDNTLVLKPNEKILLPFLSNYLRTIDWNELSTGSTQPLITQTIVKNIPIILPPLTEQQRIVAHVEALLTQINTARERLNRVPLIMKKFRQAVLAAACSGRLTEGWRGDHPNIETSSKTLENTYKKLRDEITLKIIQKRTKIAEDSPDFEISFEIPESWCWAKLETLAAFEKNAMTDGPFGSNLKTEHYSHTGPRVIRLQNISEGAFIDIKTHISQSHFETLLKNQIFSGEIAIGLLGDPIPRACIIPDGIGPAIVKADCIRFKPNSDLALVEFLVYAINEPELCTQTMESVHGVARPRLNLTQIKNYKIPLAPLAEQHEVVRRVSMLFERADAIDREVAAAGRRCERMTQAVLGKAFAGKL